MWRDKVYRFCALPFGLAPVPWIFMKVTREPCLYVRARGIHLSMYLKDWLVLASGPEACSDQAHQVLYLCCNLGFIPSEEKSYLRPFQGFKFIGMAFDTVGWLVFPNSHGIECLQSFLANLLQRSWAMAVSIAVRPDRALCTTGPSGASYKCRF